MSESVKLTLSIPKDLRERMNPFNEVVNWSELVRELFERRVTMLEQAKSKSKLSVQAIARLKASEEREADQDKAVGHEQGRLWAEEDAEVSDLRRLRAANESHNPPWHEHDENPGGALLALLDPEGDWDNDYRAGYWAERAGTESPSITFVESFVQGALEVFREYKKAR
jgi:hypothetical protein